MKDTLIAAFRALTLSVLVAVLMPSASLGQGKTEPFPLGVDIRVDADLLFGYWKIEGRRDLVLHFVTPQLGVDKWIVELYQFDQNKQKWLRLSFTGLNFENGNLNLSFRDRGGRPLSLRVSAWTMLLGGKAEIVLTSEMTRSTAAGAKIYTQHKLSRF